jgi:oligosaccharide repeat unit polymerase
VDILQLVVVVFIGAITFLNYCKHGDLLYPPVIQGLIWFIILVLYILNQSSFIPISSTMYLLILNGVFMFSCGSFLGTLGYDHVKSTFRLEPLKENMITQSVFWLPIVAFPIFVLKAFQIASQGPFNSFFINLRYNLTMSQTSDDYGLLIYLISFSFLSVGMELYRFLISKKWYRLLLCIPVALGYAIFATGRTYFLCFFFILFGTLLITRRLKPGRGFALVGIFGLAVFVLLGLAFNKGGNFDNSLQENIRSVWDNFRLYLLGALPAMDIYMNKNIEPAWGNHMFRLIFVLLSIVGLKANVQPIHQEYQMVPLPTNVYTVYYPYYNDYLFYGAFLIQFILGIIHGLVYRKAATGHPLFVFLFAVLLYPLFMQFFHDQYFNLFSMWLQYIILVSVYYYSQKVTGSR